MNKPTASLPAHLRQAATVSQLLAFATIGLAQAVPVPAPPADEVTVLTPFTVATNQDRGYRATSTLSGTRINTSLRDIGTSIQAITPEFLADTGITKVTELLQYTTGTEVSGGAGGNFSNASGSAAVFSSDNEIRQASPSTRIRGLSDASIARNLYASAIPFDSYNLSRIEVNRGANSILFGLGSPAGIINYSTNEVMWRNENNVEVRGDNFGSFRSVLDLNRVLLKDKLALRVAGLRDDTKYKQDPTFRNDRRIYATASYRPFKNTSVSVGFEKGNIDSTLPRQDPPRDYFTHFFTTGKRGYANNTDFRDFPAALGTTANIQIDSGVPGNFFIVDGPTSSGTNRAFIQFPETLYGTGVQNPLATNPARAADFRYRRVAMQNGREFLAQVFNDPLGPNAYLLALVDPTVFDFFNNNIDGRASSQYGKIEAFNAALRQEFLGGKAGFELGYDRQIYDNGYIDALDGIRGNTLKIDISQGDFAYAAPGNPASGTAVNPNYLRPLTGSRTSFADRTNKNESLRATAFFRHDFTERSSGFVAKVLGRQNVTLLASSYQNDTSSIGGQAAIMDYDQLRALGWTDANARATGSGSIGPVFYLGDSVANRTTASGLNLTGYKGALSFPNQVSINHRDAASNQIRTGTVNVYSLQNSPHERLATGIGIGRDKLDTLAAVLQSHWWDGALVSTVGFREDKIERYTAAPLPARRLDFTFTGRATLNADPTAEKTGRTKSYSGVLKVNKLVGDRAPRSTELDLHYGWSENFQGLAGSRNTKGGFYDAPVGETKEAGFSMSLFHQKLFFRANWFETSQANLVDAEMTAIINTYLFQIPSRLYDRYTLAQLNAAGFAMPPAILASGAVTIGAPNANGFAALTNVYTPTDINSALSKGFEWEATYNVSNNWRIAVNVAQVKAIQTGKGKNWAENVAWAKTNWFDKSSVGSLITGAGGTLDPVSGWIDRAITDFSSLQERDGASNPQIREWRMNAITNYSFPRTSRLKGVGVGGGIRFQDNVFLGYSGKPNPSLPTTYIADVKKPQFGPSETEFDFWSSYERRILNDKVLWKLQLNIRNAFTNDELIPIQAQLVDVYSKYPAFDGYKASGYRLYRIAAPRTIELRSTFKF